MFRLILAVDMLHPIYSLRQNFINNRYLVAPCALDIVKEFDKTNHHALIIEIIKR